MIALIDSPPGSPTPLPLPDRAWAGRALARRLASLGPDTLVLALPRGGVPVAAEIARMLGAKLELLLVRKIGVAWQPELAYAALVDGNPPELVLNAELAAELPADRAWLEAAVAEQRAELERRRARYLGGRPAPSVAGRKVVVVDDGLATGTTMRAALQALRRQGPARLVLAVPVAPASTLAALAPLADAVCCLASPEPFHAIGFHYADFHQLDDEEVDAALRRAGRP
ncbi:phosphoribosyltransferase [Rivibacter subsaxonicus]|uniref:Putative phosphoribosyltransferase n=1 Tax=Rivibacter subsaxonicus TaxID=457575 RepID=A0A4Q7VV36_9BURK|nr:phosphoribosyltransferase family protein [Rivibacter subsaxonicus]RZU00517.1 putative phosphoribosyltransferase [Rivibacter subsaxonicus]